MFTQLIVISRWNFKKYIHLNSCATELKSKVAILAFRIDLAWNFAYYALFSCRIIKSILLQNLAFFQTPKSKQDWEFQLHGNYLLLQTGGHKMISPTKKGTNCSGTWRKKYITMKLHGVWQKMSLWSEVKHRYRNNITA